MEDKAKDNSQSWHIEVLRKDIKLVINGLLRACGEKALTFAEEGRLIAKKEYGVRYVVEEIWKRLDGR